MDAGPGRISHTSLLTPPFSAWPFTRSKCCRHVNTSGVDGCARPRPHFSHLLSQLGHSLDPKCCRHVNTSGVDGCRPRPHFSHLPSHTPFLSLAIHSIQVLQACKYLRRGWMQAQACTGVLRGTKRLNMPSKPVWLYMQARLGLTCHTKALHREFIDNLKAISGSTLSRQG